MKKQCFVCLYIFDHWLNVLRVLIWSRPTLVRHVTLSTLYSCMDYSNFKFKSINSSENEIQINPLLIIKGVIFFLKYWFFWQTVKILMRRLVSSRLIWICTVCNEWHLKRPAWLKGLIIKTHVMVSEQTLFFDNLFRAWRHQIVHDYAGHYSVNETFQILINDRFDHFLTM